MAQGAEGADGDGDYEIPEGEGVDDEATLEEEERRARELGDAGGEAEVSAWLRLGFRGETSRSPRSSFLLVPEAFCSLEYRSRRSSCSSFCARTPDRAFEACCAGGSIDASARVFAPGNTCREEQDAGLERCASGVVEGRKALSRGERRRRPARGKRWVQIGPWGEFTFCAVGLRLSEGALDAVPLKRETRHVCSTS